MVFFLANALKIFDGGWMPLVLGLGLVALMTSWRRGRALLLHGGGQTRHAWDATARSLARAGVDAIALDQRGHGESDWIADGSYSFLDYGADAAYVARALRNAGGAPPIAIGASLGGIASLAALADDGHVFSGLVLVDVTPRLDPKGVSHVQGFMRARAREGFASVEEAADAIAQYLPHRPRPRSLAGLAKNLRLGEGGRYYWHWDPRFLDGPRPVNHEAEVSRARIAQAARDLAVPTLLVRGMDSEMVGDAEEAAFRALCPQAEVARVEKARHMVAGDANDAFGAAILGFLAKWPG